MFSTTANGKKRWSSHFLIILIGLTALGILNATDDSDKNCDIYEDNCYIIVDENEINFTSSMEACEGIEGNFLLAEIDSIEEFDSLRGWLNGTDSDVSNYWVAASDQNKEGEWKWLYSGNELQTNDRRYWLPNTPNGNEFQNCSRMFLNPNLDLSEAYKLDDGNCEDFFGYICKQQDPPTNDDILKRLIELEDNVSQTDIRDHLQLVEFVNELANILSEWSQKTTITPEEVTEFSLRALRVASNLTDAEYGEYWAELSNNIAEQLVTEMDKFSKKVANSMSMNENQMSPIIFTTENIIMTIIVYPNAEELSTTDLSSIDIPTKLLSAPDIVFSSVSLVYKTASLFMFGKVSLIDGETLLNLNVGSEVISSVVSPEISSPFTEEVILTIFKSKNGTELECGFLVEGKGYWSTEGCKIVENTAEYTVCACNHLTNFAILMQITAVEISETSNEALELITIIGCSISVLFLLITFLIFSAIIKIKSERGLIVKSLVASMALAQLLFVVGIRETKIKPLCQTIAVFLHFLYLSSFFWMLIHAVHVFLKSRNYTLPPKTRLYYSLTGWGTPVVIVGITLAIKFNQYLHSDFCWLSTSEGIIFSFVGPVLLVLAANLAILVLVIKSFMSVRANAKKNELDKIRAGIRAILVLLPVMGLTWLFGVLQFGGAAEVFAYLFAIINSLQGFSVFACLCLMNKEVRESLTKKIDKRSQTSSSGDSSSGDSSKKLAWPSDGNSMSSSSRNKTATETLSITETRNV